MYHPPLPHAPSASRPRASPLLLSLVACRGRGAEEDAVRPLAGAARGWNVLLLSVDTLRADRLGAYGYAARPNSPRLDALLGSGVRFDAAMAPRATHLAVAGLDPDRPLPGGARRGRERLRLPRRRCRPCPSCLHGAGYETGAFLSNMCRAEPPRLGRLRLQRRRGRQDGAAGARVGAGARRASGRSSSGSTSSAPTPPTTTAATARRGSTPATAGPLGPKKWQLDRIMRERLPLGAARRRPPRRALRRGGRGERPAGRQPPRRPARGGPAGADGRRLPLRPRRGALRPPRLPLPRLLGLPDGPARAARDRRAGAAAGGRAVARDTVELVDVAPTLLALLGLPPLGESTGGRCCRYLERPAAERARAAGLLASTAPSRSTPCSPAAGSWSTTRAASRRSASPARRRTTTPSPAPSSTTWRAIPARPRTSPQREPARVTRLARLIRQRFAGVRNRAARQELPEQLEEGAQEPRLRGARDATPPLT